MTTFTIFYNQIRDIYASVYDFALPTPTGIGEKKEWVPVYHGETTGLLDRANRCKDFEKRQREAKVKP